MADLPKFDEPPLVEAVLSAQFAPLPGLTPAHLGLYWRERLGGPAGNWSNVTEAPRLPDVFERFGEEREWVPTPQVRITQQFESQRLQFASTDQERMIQIQDSRFAYNWRRRTGIYPMFDTLLPDFQRAYREFSEFLRALGIGEPHLNQWELTYVNHILRGTIWETPDQWGDLSPAFANPLQVAGQHLEAIQCMWTFLIGDRRGRVVVRASNGRLGSREGEELMLLELTARGPIATGSIEELGQGLKLGHDHVVLSFVNMTSSRAHKTWKLTR
jgi:uncharacterized protein (TIGR04255 family)